MGDAVGNIVIKLFNNVKCLPLFAAAFLLPSALLAQQAGGSGESLMIDAGPCLNFETSVERLVCFEEQAKAAATARQGAATTATVNSLPVLKIQRSTPAPAQTRTTTSTAPAQEGAPTSITPSPAVAVSGDSFGLPESGAKEASKELFSSIASFTEIQPNQYVITLVNGQVWRQMRTERYNISEGQDVRIYPTRWGSSYRLTVKELGGFIQVERIR